MYQSAPKIHDFQLVHYIKFPQFQVNARIAKEMFIFFVQEYNWMRPGLLTSSRNYSKKRFISKQRTQQFHINICSKHSYLSHSHVVCPKMYESSYSLINSLIWALKINYKYGGLFLVYQINNN